jgi:DNA-binding MarR family transcriptional regulator
MYRAAIISRCDITPAGRYGYWGKPLLLKKAERRFNLATEDYARLAAFRQGVREFLRFSEEAAERAGLSAQQYQAMLILRASEGASTSINDLARQLIIKHNSAVGLVDRLVKEGLARRATSGGDRRKVELELTARGRQILAKLAETHRAELERFGPELKRLIADVLRSGQ